MRRLGVLGVVLALIAAIPLMANLSAAKDGRSMTVREMWRAAPSSVPAASGRHQRLVFVETNHKETEIDNPPAGQSQGDELAFSSILRRHGQAVGRADAHVTVTHLGQNEFRALFNGTASLPHGEIELQGVAVFTRQTAEFNFGITGGTGAFDDAGGNFHVVEQGQKVKLIFDVLHLH